MTTTPHPDLEALDVFMARANGLTVTFSRGGPLPEFLEALANAYPSLAARIRNLESENERQTWQIEQSRLEFPMTAQARIAEARDAELDAKARLQQTKAYVADLEAQISGLRKIMRQMLFDGGTFPDHMTACERTMGRTHPCTCGANEACALLNIEAQT